MKKLPRVARSKNGGQKMSKNKWFNIRVDEEEKRKIEARARKYKMTTSRFLLSQALEKEVKTRKVLYLEQSTKFLLKNLANNINQIAIELHQQEQAKSVFNRFNYTDKINQLNLLIQEIKEALNER